MSKQYYCLCESNCKYPTMTTEQILAAIQQAAQLGVIYDPDAAVVTKVRELNGGQALSFWVGTQAQYNALSVKDPNCYFIITDKKVDDATADAARALEAATAAQETAAAAMNAVNSAPKFYFSETEPTDWKNGDIWLKPVEG